MDSGYVGILSVDLHLPGSASLKHKRKELLRVKAGLTRRFACAVAEVDHHDLWQRSRLTLALVGRAAGEVDERLAAAARHLDTDPEFQVVGMTRELVTVGADEPIGEWAG